VSIGWPAPLQGTLPAVGGLEMTGGFAVKKLLKFVFVVALVFGGWALAAASLHVVRAPGTMAFGYVPFKLQLITKNAITFRETYVDTTKWSVVDADAHKDFVNRLEQLNKADLVAHVKPAADAQPAAAAKPAEEKTEFTLVLNSAGEKKINVIKEVRTITGLGLKEAKDLVEGAPKTVKEGLSKEDVNKFADMLKAAGATVEIK
jgi:large subunit ribosomal protein L7/L12